jgi:hypothetical protein
MSVGEEPVGAAGGGVALDRERLGELADALIPASEGMPSATEAGAAGEWLDAVLAARPDLAVPLGGVTAAAAGLDAAAAIAALPTRDPGGWAAFTTAVPAAYFMNPDVRDRLGYPGQRAVPIDPDEPPDYLEDGLLDSVRARPPVYRPTP